MVEYMCTRERERERNRECECVWAIKKEINMSERFLLLER